MDNAISEKLIAKILSIGAAVTTLLIISGSVTDPVNTPKLLAVGIVGFAAVSVLLSSESLNYVRQYKLALLFASLFTLAMVVAVVASESPLTQNLYGSYGRNNGFFAYIFLLLIFISSLAFRGSKSFETVVKALLLAGLVNVFYCIWVIMFGDFIGWSNPYGNILGTLGNPNFIGSFLGIFFTAYLIFAMGKTSAKITKYSLWLVLPLTGLSIYQSKAIQGRVVTALGIGILGFLIIRSKFGKLLTGVYLIVGSLVGLFALLGALQVGPLTKYIYKTSVSLRGQYWLAGWNTGESHPLTGVGMDSFGDWYRRSRDIHAIELPGVNVIVNAAHNVPMDMFAFGGWPLLLTYLSIMGLAAMAAFRVILRRKAFDPTFAVLITAWVGYQLQSIISINQIGLAVWGWFLSGVLIAYERATRDGNLAGTQPISRQAKRSQAVAVHPKLVLASAIGSLIGMLVALPPLASDIKWRSAQQARTVPGIESTMTAGYFNPQNSTMYLNNIQSLEGSNLPDLAVKYARQAVSWNPEAFELWKVLYLIRNSTEDEKALALQNMKRLDPLNPDVTSVK
jgi:hypothetical protein